MMISNSVRSGTGSMGEGPCDGNRAGATRLWIRAARPITAARVGFRRERSVSQGAGKARNASSFGCDAVRPQPASGLLSWCWRMVPAQPLNNGNWAEFPDARQALLAHDTRHDSG